VLGLIGCPGNQGESVIHLTALQGQVDGAVICISPKAVEPVFVRRLLLRENIWLQWGADTPETAKLGRDLGLNMVTGKCILMYAERSVRYTVSIASFVKLFGKL